MKTCKDCYHFDVCVDKLGTTKFYDNVIAANNVEDLCPTFKAKTLVLDLPFPPGGDIYIIDEGVILKLTIAIMHIGFVSDEDTYYELIDSESNEGYWDFKKLDLGRTVFLTREAAEQALKEKHTNG